MTKEATLQVRMDADLKKQAEALYRGMLRTYRALFQLRAKLCKLSRRSTDVHATHF